MAKKNNGGTIALGVLAAAAVAGIAIAMTGDDDEEQTASSSCTEVKRGDYRRQQYAIQACPQADGSLRYVGIVLIPMQEPVRQPEGVMLAQGAEAWVHAWVDANLGPEDGPPRRVEVGPPRRVGGVG